MKSSARSCFALAIFLTISGCGTLAPKRKADTLILRINQNPTTLDPAYSTDVISGKLIGLIFNNLVRYDAQGKLIPDIAKSWTISDDGLEYQFKLRENACFSNGRAIVAADVVYSYTRCLDPATASTRTWVFTPIEGAIAFSKGKAKSVSGLKTNGDHSLSIKLSKAFAPFLGFLAMPAGAIVPKEEVKRLGKNFANQAIGSGPFQLVEWLRDKHLVFKANPTCPTGAPKLTNIRFRILKEPITASVEFKSGRIDAMIIPFADQEFYSKHPIWSKHILSHTGQNVYFLGLNCTRPPFDRIDVRQAIAHAIDAQAIVNTVRKGQAVIAHGPIPPGISGYDPNFQGLKYDPKKSIALLKKAGLYDKLEIEIVQGSNKQNLEVTRLIQSFLIQVGIKVRLSSLEWGIFTRRLKKGNFDAFYRSWWADYPDGENFLYPLFHTARKGPGGNWPLFSDPKIDRRIEKVQAMVDEKMRIEAYKGIARDVTFSASRTFLFHKTEPIIVQPWVQNFELFPVFNANKYDKVFIDKSLLNAVP